MQIRDIFKRPSLIGTIFGILLMAASLTPSLIPRSWTAQAIIAALSFLCGYAIGVGFGALWRHLELPTVPEQYRKMTAWLSLGLCGLLLLYALFKTSAWQNSVRQMVGQEPVDSAYPLRMILLAAVLALLLLLAFRFLWWIVQVIARTIAKYVPHRYGQVLGITIGLVLVITLVNGVLIDTVADAMNASYAVTDSSSYENVAPPTSTLRSGSPESLADWETLGREGRRFVGTGPNAAEIADFKGGESASEPIRVYVGSKSAESLDERAELVLQELIRTGAFERDQLMLVTSTGNGWVDSNAVDSFEYMYGGDTAIAAFQYSYLPSAISLVADKDAATEASLATFNAIHQYWQELDEETRPDFYLYGLSLGAYGSQAAISRVNLLNDPIDGALWAGPPFVSEFWRQTTDDRESGTPVWRPVYQGGKTIRFTNLGEGLQESPESWADNRFIYLQQAGDPIVFFTVDSLYRVPEWLHEDSRSPKVPPEMTWYPVATFWQLVFDMLLGTSDTLPDGNGHRYGIDSYIDSWVALTQPEEWTSQMTEDLKALFHSQGNPNKP